MWIGCEELFYQLPRFSRLSAPVPLNPRLGCAAKVPVTPLVPLLARLTPGVDKTTGLRLYPGLTGVFP